MQCSPGSLLALGGDQVCNGFGLGEINLVIVKSAFAEFSGTCCTCAARNRILHQHIQHYPATVALQFKHVFTGK